METLMGRCLYLLNDMENGDLFQSSMNPVLCILSGCIGAGKTTLAREPLPRLGLMSF